MDVLWQPADEKMSTYIREKERKRLWSEFMFIIIGCAVIICFFEILLFSFSFQEWNERDIPWRITPSRNMLKEEIIEQQQPVLMCVGICVLVLVLFLLWRGGRYRLYKTKCIYFCCGKCVGKERYVFRYIHDYKLVCIPDGSGKEEEIKVDRKEYYQIDYGNRVLLIVFADWSTHIENVYPLSEFWPEERSV